MKLHLGEKDFDLNTDGDGDKIRALISNMFWLLLAWMALSFLRPTTAANWIRWYRKKAAELKAEWGDRLGHLAGVTLDTISDWTGWLLEGGFKLIRWIMTIATILVGLYVLGMTVLPPLMPFFALLIGLAVLLILTVVQLVPAKLWPGDKTRALNVIGIMAMWPIALAFAFVCFPFTWTGTFVMMLCLIAVFYLARGGRFRTARIAATFVLWSAVAYQAVSTGIPALSEQRIVGGWPSELAMKVRLWHATGGSQAEIDSQTLLEIEAYTYGQSTDTIKFAALPVLDGSGVGVSIIEIPLSIEPGERLKVLSSSSLAALKGQFPGNLIFQAIGDTTAGYLAEASRILGYGERPPRLVSYMDVQPSKSKEFDQRYGTPVFWVPWNSVLPVAGATAMAGATSGAARGEDSPPFLALRYMANGKLCTGSVPLTLLQPRMNSDGSYTVTLHGREAEGYRMPLRLKPGDRVICEYIDGTVGFNLLDGRPDPKYSEMNTGFVDPCGFPPSSLSELWHRIGYRMVAEAPYGALLWGTSPDGSTLAEAFEDCEYGASSGELIADRQSQHLYLVFNDLVYGSKYVSGGNLSLADQVTKRAGSTRIRVSVYRGGEAASNELGYAASQ